MTSRARAFCSEVSQESGEPIAGTASRVDNWILVEYRGVWNSDALAGSGLSDQVKAHLRAQVRALWPAKLLFIRRRERRAPREGLVVFRFEDGVGRRFQIERYDELPGLDRDRGAPLEHPLFLVCTHGKHDPCCARYGRPLYDVLVDQADESWIWQVTHVGGDRFAGNVVVLPDGLYYGRVRPEEAWILLDEHLAERIYLDRFRGRSSLPFAVQAAEIAVRERFGLTAIELPEIESAPTPETNRWSVRLLVENRRFEVELRVEPGPLTYLTCSAEHLRHPPRYVVETLRESDA
jgi:hypothetical protein